MVMAFSLWPSEFWVD